MWITTRVATHLNINPLRFATSRIMTPFALRCLNGTASMMEKSSSRRADREGGKHEPKFHPLGFPAVLLGLTDALASIHIPYAPSSRDFQRRVAENHQRASAGISTNLLGNLTSKVTPDQAGGRKKGADSAHPEAAPMQGDDRRGPVIVRLAPCKHHTNREESFRHGVRLESVIQSWPHMSGMLQCRPW